MFSKVSEYKRQLKTQLHLNARKKSVRNIILKNYISTKNYKVP